MKKLVVVAVVAALVGGMSAYAVGAAKQKPASPRSSAVELHKLNTRLDSVAKPTVARVNCRTLRCINQTLSAQKAELALHKRVLKNIVGFLNCIGSANMTEYTGYQADDGVSTYTALDFTQSGDLADIETLGWGC